MGIRKNSQTIPYFFEGVPESVRYAFNPLLVTARNVYDSTGDDLRLEVEVVDPIVENMGMEVHPFIRPFSFNLIGLKNCSILVKSAKPRVDI